MRTEEEIRKRLSIREGFDDNSSVIYALIQELKWVLGED